MGRDSADHRALAFAAIVAGLTVVCLIAALALPRLPRGPWILGPILLVVAVPFLSRVADRGRVRHAVGELGGEWLAMRRWGFWKDMPDREWTTYDVVFRDGPGNYHLATCRTGLLWGVQWVDDAVYPDEASLREAARGRGWRRVRFESAAG
ncbi:MAG: hypothetical protein JNL97_04860 [Verrucomicrobiales bacterium]|nr:hypothetical protein [Verrucomicrobiales bacterium]